MQKFILKPTFSSQQKGLLTSLVSPLFALQKHVHYSLPIVFQKQQRAFSTALPANDSQRKSSDSNDLPSFGWTWTLSDEAVESQEPVKEKLPDVFDYGFMGYKGAMLPDEMEMFEKMPSPLDEFFAPDGMTTDETSVLF